MSIAVEKSAKLISIFAELIQLSDQLGKMVKEHGLFSRDRG
jgi:hypothetical protein